MPLIPASAFVAAVAVLIGAGTAGAEDAGVQRGRELFTAQAKPACAICHALKDANAQGMVGPSLDELRPDATRVLQAIRNGIGAMPAYDEQSLSNEDAQALARYVAKASGAAQ